MAFRKTSEAIDTRPLTEEEAREAAAVAWEIGQVHPSDPDIIWDGERWIPRAEWEARATEE
jgi:hypothetical protein